MDARDHRLQLRLDLLIAVEVTLVQLLFVAGHRAEIHPFVLFPANLIVQEVLVVILLILFLSSLPHLQELIELLPAHALLTLKVFVKQLHPLLLIVGVHPIGVGLRQLVLSQCSRIGHHAGAGVGILVPPLAIVVLNSVRLIGAFLKMINISLHLIVDPLVVLVAIVQILQFFLRLVVEAALPLLLVHLLLLFRHYFLLIFLV